MAGFEKRKGKKEMQFYYNLKIFQNQKINKL